MSIKGDGSLITWASREIRTVSRGPKGGLYTWRQTHVVLSPRFSRFPAKPSLRFPLRKNAFLFSFVFLLPLSFSHGDSEKYASKAVGAAVTHTPFQLTFRSLYSSERGANVSAEYSISVRIFR
jgi:hypothetical protein